MAAFGWLHKISPLLGKCRFLPHFCKILGICESFHPFFYKNRPSNASLNGEMGVSSVKLKKNADFEKEADILARQSKNRTIICAK